MMRYIRAEFYKVFRRKYTWVALIVLLALEGLLVAGWVFTNVNGNHVDFYTGAAMLCTMLSLGFYATLLTCDMVFADQYKNSTMKNEVAFGLPRSRIYLGKFVVELAVSLLFMAVMAGFYLALCWFFLYRDPGQDAVAMELVGYSLLTALPLWIGVLSCTCAFYFLVRSNLWACLASLCVFMILPTVIGVAGLFVGDTGLRPVLDFLHQHMPTVMLENAPYIAGDWAACGQAWIVGAIWLVVFTAIGLWGFRRKEIQ